ncbi:choline-binding surface protein A [Streptococcus pneumoniae]|nr:YSIRK-type signal peptide-containing protein [Streptococcus pneumoniae]CKL87566.1 choline-binding surface protein A [Streptococcus pneumoniae]
MFASKSERKVRYSIRKFSIGVASVVVASLFLGGVVHAEGSVPANHPSPQKVSSGDKEYEDVVRKVNIELSEYMDKSLNKLN